VYRVTLRKLFWERYYFLLCF